MLERLFELAEALDPVLSLNGHHDLGFFVSLGLEQLLRSGHNCELVPDVLQLVLEQLVLGLLLPEHLRVLRQLVAADELVSSFFAFVLFLLAGHLLLKLRLLLLQALQGLQHLLLLLADGRGLLLVN